MTKRNGAIRRLSQDRGAGRKTLQRLRSVPTWFLRHNSTEETKPTGGNIFQYPDTTKPEPNNKMTTNTESLSPLSNHKVEQINHIENNQTKEE